MGDSLLVLLLLVSFSGAALATFPAFCDSTNASFLPGGYDYIVVGAGASGCPLATTLSQKFKVLLLERGQSPYDNPILMREENFLLAFNDPESSQPFVTTDGVSNNRPRVLGGGTSINGGFYSRAGASEIKSMGLNFDKVYAAYNWVEAVLVRIPLLGPFMQTFRKSLLEVGVIPDNGATYEHRVGTKVGGTTFDSNGTRRPASDLFVYANSCNLQVVLQAIVQRIIFVEGSTTAKGVVFTDYLGNNHTVFLKDNPSSEVILSAGAIGSPQLLLLSGIGPSRDLKEMGIPVLFDSPLVGKNFVDPPQKLVYIVSASPVEVSLVRVVGVTRAGSYVESICGLEEFASIAIFSDVGYPRSRGELVLQTLNADDVPIITFNYLEDPHDIAVCVDGAKTMEEMLLSESLRPYVFDTQPLPSGGTAWNPGSRNTSLVTFCTTNITTEWHYHGSCRVNQVVDSQYRVLGTQSLRVVDASVFSFSPGTNPQATFMMFGRYVGLEILEGHLT